MKTKIVSSQEIASCKTHNLSPEHWIPEHKLEECEAYALAVKEVELNDAPVELLDLFGQTND